MPDPKRPVLKTIIVDENSQKKIIDLDLYIKLALLFCRDLAILHFEVVEIKDEIE